MDDEQAFRIIDDRVQRGLQQLAAENGARFVGVSDEQIHPHAPARSYRLLSQVEGSAQLEVLLDDAWSTYLDVGEGGCIKVPTHPADPEGGADRVIRIAAAIAAGRVRQRVWTKRRTGAFVDSRLYLQDEPGDPWRPVGFGGGPPMLIRRWCYDEEVLDYRPFRA